jgi:hypothetical protein
MMVARFVLASLIGMVSSASTLPRAQADDFPVAPESPTASSDAGRGFGEEGGISTAEKAESERDRAEIGGRLRVEGVLTQLREQAFRNATFKSGSGAELYLDAKAADGVRALLRARVEQAVDTSASDGEKKSKSPLFAIDEAKVQANFRKILFVTAGRQKMKFGAAKFFNPTDFPNRQRRDPFALEDRRPGVDGLKLHLPLGTTNLYAMALPSESGVVGETAGYGRAEFAFPAGELSVSTLTERNQEIKAGADISLALGDLDFYGEVAADGHESYAGGFTWDVKLSDSDAMTLGAEYFRNGIGFTDSADYLAALRLGTHQPLELGREYAALSAYLAKPRWMKDATFVVSYLENLSDRSRVVVPQVLYAVTPDLTASLRLALPSGEAEGEFRLTGHRLQATMALEALL